MRHIISLDEMTMDEWHSLYSVCEQIMAHPEDFSDRCRTKIMASLFYEPSTRTNLSHQAAMLRLGGSVIGFSDPQVSSVSKGETLKDTIIMASTYADVVVMRNPKEGAALAASLYSSVPIISAGDGGHLHPTQTLTDLTTITRYRGSIDGINIGFCGDLKNGRTVHSLISALVKFENVNFYLISPRELTIPDFERRLLKEHNCKFFEITGLDPIIPVLDVLYMTRIQRERFVDPLEYERLKGVYILDKGKMTRAKKDMIVLHPLPRVDEISGEIDDDPRAGYFEQARCGMFIRMALILHVLESGRIRPEKLAAKEQPQLCHNSRCITQTEKYLPPMTGINGDKTVCAYCDKEI
ncbi:MAG: aspartate carbamoyltransferase [Clostridiales bacterium]|nr:aspartate carbamoyltransferase [Clostridiales bacterium]